MHATDITMARHGVLLTLGIETGETFCSKNQIHEKTKTKNQLKLVQCGWLSRVGLSTNVIFLTSSTNAAAELKV